MSINRSVARALGKLIDTTAIHKAVIGALNFKQIEQDMPRTSSRVIRGVVYNPNISTKLMDYVTAKGVDKNLLDFKGAHSGDYAYVSFTYNQRVANGFSGMVIPTLVRNAYNGSIGLQIVCNPPVYQIDAEKVMQVHLRETNFVPQEQDWVGKELHECEITGFHPDLRTPVIEKSDIHYIQVTLGGLPVGQLYVNPKFIPRVFQIAVVSADETQTQELEEKYKRQKLIEPDDRLIRPAEAVQIAQELRHLQESVSAIDLSTPEGLVLYSELPAPRTFNTYNQYFTRDQAQEKLDELRRTLEITTVSQYGFFSTPSKVDDDKLENEKSNRQTFL